MKIGKLHVQGYRSLRNVSWTPGDLNILIGPNGSGKSNLIRLLELLSISACGGLGKHVRREGGMEPLLWDGRLDSLVVGLHSTPLDPAASVERDSLTYELELERLGGGSSYRISHERLVNHCLVQLGEQEKPFKFLERNLHRADIFDESQRALAAQESVPEEETLLSSFSGPFSASRVVSAYQRHLFSWCVYQDILTHRDAPLRQPSVARTETLVAPDGQNLIPVLHTLYSADREFKKDLNAAMVAAFGDDFEELVFPPAADQRIQLRIRWKSLRREQSAADLSDGTLRFLLLLTILARPIPGSLLAIDEPETGLHPSMLPILAEWASEAARQAQVIFTTHSAEFLDAFGEVLPTTTIAQWADGETRLRVVADEELDHWLETYTLGAMYRSGELEQLP